MIDERPIPDAALKDENAVEMIRVWVAGQKLHCSLKIGMYEEGGMNFKEGTAWGIILADVTRHVAQAMENLYSYNQQETIRDIQVSFLKELGKPTSEATGQFVAKPGKY